MLFKPERLWINIVVQLAAFTVFLLPQTHFSSTSKHSWSSQSSYEVHTVQFDFNNYTLNLFCVFKKKKKKVLICAFCYMHVEGVQTALAHTLKWSETNATSWKNKTKTTRPTFVNPHALVEYRNYVLHLISQYSKQRLSFMHANKLTKALLVQRKCSQMACEIETSQTMIEDRYAVPVTHCYITRQSALGPSLKAPT